VNTGELHRSHNRGQVGRAKLDLVHPAKRTSLTLLEAQSGHLPKSIKNGIAKGRGVAQIFCVARRNRHHNPGRQYTGVSKSSPLIAISLEGSSGNCVFAANDW
jgi:hypothetical protein